MDDMTMITLVMVGFALVVAASWQLASQRPFDAIEFTARLVVSFLGAAAMAALLYGLVFTIGMANIAGSGSNTDAYLQTSFWISIVVAFAIAMTRSEDRKASLLRFLASWIVAWVCVVGVGILLFLGVCAVMFLV